MGQTLTGAMTSGLALAGVLAVAGVASARLGRAFPHLGVAALGAAAAVLAGRMSMSPVAITALAVLAAAAVVGAIGWWFDTRLAGSPATRWPLPLLPEVVVLGLGVATAALLRLPTAVELPLGALGGVASTTAAAVAAVIGFAVAVALGAPALRRLPLVGLWVVASLGIAAAVAIGSGMLPVAGTPSLPAFGIPDIVGIALRATAVGVLARQGLGWGLAAAALLGIGEAALRASTSGSGVVLLVYLAIVAAGLWRAAVDRVFAPV